MLQVDQTSAPLNADAAASSAKEAVRNTYWPVLSCWIGVLILCAPAFRNGFPFLYSDTVTYLVGGFLHEVSEIRPVTYGWFMRHASLNDSWWFIVIFQALITSWSIHAFFSAFSHALVTFRPLAVILLLSLTTRIGEVTGMLMPDFQTPVMVLTAAVLLYGRLTWWRGTIAAGLLWLAVASHHSNAYTLFFTMSATLAFYAVRRWQKRTSFVSLRRWFLTAGIVTLGFFTIPWLHWQYSGEFYWSKARSIFLTNRIHQAGLLAPFLREHCAAGQYALCTIKDSLPEDLLWGANSPLHQRGSWAAHEAEYARLVGDFLAQPRFAKKFYIRTLENAAIQFFSFEGQVVFPERENGYLIQLIQSIAPEYMPAIHRSLQYHDQWDDALTAALQRIVVWASFAFLLYLFVYRRTGAGEMPLAAALTGFVVLALLANAAVCGGVSMVDPRFQNRIVWLVVLLACYIGMEHRRLLRSILIT